MIGARRFTSSARSISSIGEGVERPGGRAERRLPPGCRPRPPRRPAGRPRRARRGRRRARGRRARLPAARARRCAGPSGSASRRAPRRALAIAWPMPPVAPVSRTVEPEICTSCEPIRMEIIALFGPTGVGKTAVAIALARLLRARGEDPVAVSADALQVYAGLETLTGAATPAEQARARAPPALVPAARRDLQRRAVRRAGPRPDRRAARARAAPDRRRRHRPLPARRAGRARPAPAAAGGRARALDRRARTRRPAGAARAPGRAARPGRPRGSSPTTASASCARSSCTSSASSSRPRGPRSCGASELRHPTLLAGLTMDREELYEAIDRRVERWSPPAPREEVLRARAAGVSETAAQGARLRGARSRATSRG